MGKRAGRKHRRARRNTIAIKRWMLKQRLLQRDIIEATGVDHSYVSKTITGDRHSRLVLRWLLDKGCPPKYLALPDDIKEEWDERGNDAD